MTRFVAKWGDAVREQVETAALDPARPSARAIHAGLVAAATGEKGALSASDIPPAATIAKWVSEIRRDARDAITGNPAAFEKLNADLMKKLRASVTKASTPAEIAACAKAARELAGLDRDLKRPAPAKPGRKPRDPGTSPAQSDADAPDDAQSDEDAFLRTLAESDAAQPRNA